MTISVANIQLQSYHRQHMETLVSVESAAYLQDVSMQRFQIESAGDMKLRRFLGHVSVNRRSTEILRTAIFPDDIISELDNDPTYDEDAVQFTSFPSQEPPPVADLVVDIAPEHKADQWVQLPLLAEKIALSTSYDVGDWTPYIPKAADIRAMGADAELLMAIEEDWMYDVLNLHIDCNPLLEPISVEQLPKSVAIQLWKIMLEALAGFANRKAELESNRRMSRLEAFGNQEQNLLVGLGLNCHSVQSDMCNSRLQLAI